MAKKYGFIPVMVSALVAVAGAAVGSGLGIAFAPRIPDVKGVAVGKSPTETVVRRGKLRTFSTSGCLSFSYAGDDRPKGGGTDAGREWFFACFPEEKDFSVLENRLGMFADGENDGTTYEIVGEKGEDDCGYYEDVCLESIMIREIGPIGTE